MSIETLATILTMFGVREILFRFINRRKTQADVRATDAGAASEISEAAGAVVKLLRTEIEILKGKTDDCKKLYEEVFEKFKDGEAFKAVLEAEMKYQKDMRRDQQKTIEALQKIVRRHSAHIVDLQDEIEQSKSSSPKPL